MDYEVAASAVATPAPNGAMETTMMGGFAIKSLTGSSMSLANALSTPVKRALRWRILEAVHGISVGGLDSFFKMLDRYDRRGLGNLSKRRFRSVIDRVVKPALSKKEMVTLAGDFEDEATGRISITKFMDYLKINGADLVCFMSFHVFYEFSCVFRILIKCTLLFASHVCASAAVVKPSFTHHHLL